MNVITHRMGRLAASFLLSVILLVLGRHALLASTSAPNVVQCTGTVGDTNLLGAAIDAANTSPGHEVITIQRDGDQPCRFEFSLAMAPNQALPMIRESLTIRGDGVKLEREGAASQMRLFRTSASTVTLNLEEMSIYYFEAPPNSPNGGAIYAPGDVKMDDVTFYGNYAEAGKGGAVRSLGNVTVTSSHFMTNSAKVQGGALAVFGHLVIDGSSSIEHNSSDGAGGAIHAGSLDLDSSSLIGNSSADMGGAIYVEGAVATVDGALFERNRASESGGAIASQPLTTHLAISGTTFIDNVTLETGGAAVAAQLDITNSHVYSNLAEAAGGVAAALTLTVDSSTFLSNTATSTAGAAFAGMTVVHDSHFEGNRAGGNGSNLAGALYIAGHGGLISRSYFTRNVASGSNSGGGAIASLGLALDISETIFDSNRVGQSSTDGLGGAILSLSPTDVERSIFRGNSATGSGSALWLGDFIAGPRRIINNLVVDDSGSPAASIVVTGVETVALQQIVPLATGFPDPAGNVRPSATGPITDGSHLYHNTIVGPANLGLLVDTATAYVYNNIFADMETGMRLDGTAQVSAGNNLYHAVNTPEASNAQVSQPILLRDPLFIDANEGDFRLQNHSPAVDAGRDVAVLDDLDALPRPIGKGPDIGAYENPNASDSYHIYLPLVLRE